MTRPGISVPAWVMQVNRPARLFVEAGLTILVACLVARLFWLMIAPTDAVAALEERPLPAMMTSTGGTAIVADRTLLLRENPFRETIGGPVDDLTSDAPATQLNLKLVGLMTSTREGGGSATIRTPDNEEIRFVPGDMILADVQLDRVLRDRVVLSRNGRDEVLLLDGRQAGLSVIGDPASIGINEGVIARAPLELTRRVNGLALIAALEITPMQEGSRVAGYQIAPRGDVSVMSAAGLQAGDVVRAVDGLSVSQITPDQLISKFDTGDIVDLELERGDDTIRLRLELDEG